MKSRHAQRFNHDSIAVDYDEDVKNEQNPIRAGYARLMGWITAKTEGSRNIVDLGCGTGNTVLHIKSHQKIYCVDISENMLRIARDKLRRSHGIVFVAKDILDFLDGLERDDKIDTIISTYALHHLTQEDKHVLFEKAYLSLPETGKIIFGDLMFKDKGHEAEMKKRYPGLIEEFDNEFYWYVDEEARILESIGFKIEVERFSDLSWGIYGEK